MVRKTKAQKRASADHLAKRWVYSKRLWWRCLRRGNAARQERHNKARIVDATAMIASEYSSEWWISMMSAYVSQAKEETP
ncbi:hypothetical protein QJS10_CPB11g00240 [Acorus calamus]|uniref:Uncharacterized protein n=1 Tax=Acorus calamus TaxID=4465 RepID=A0AAV9DR40_ACOCL|nr:hypothetical protein QJS10_CPB11g00240 [Acorus calamus]